jgi:hypothetical protein
MELDENENAIRNSGKEKNCICVAGCVHTPELRFEVQSTASVPVLVPEPAEPCWYHPSEPHQR